MNRLLVTILLIFSLSGCAFLNKPVSIPTGTPVNINPDLLKECPLLDEGLQVATFEDVVIVYSNLAKTYGYCAMQQKNSVKLIKELGNIK
jgi:hypothetical protein